MKKSTNKAIFARSVSRSLRGRLSSLVLLLVSVSMVTGLAFSSVVPAFAATPQLNCFSSPGSCGYPDPATHNVGVNDCSSLPNFSFSSIPAGTYYSGSGDTLEIVANNVTISNLNMTDVTIYVSDVNNFTLDNVCMNTNGNANLASAAITISANSDGTTIENSTLSGANDTTGSLGVILNNNGSNTLVKNNYMYNAGGGAPGAGGGSATVENNYELVNAIVPSQHYEPVYCSDNTLTVHHNTLINVHDQTAEIFCDTGGGSGGACDNHLTITDNLLAGGGYVLYPCGNASSVGTGTSDIENNRLARCLGTPFFDGSGTICTGLTPDTDDGHGYFPKDGYYGITSGYFPGAGQTWCGNFWDDTGVFVGSDGGASSSCTPDPDPGGGGSSGGSSSGSSSATTPKTPNTGFGLVSAHPLESLVTSSAAALILLGLRQLLTRKQAGVS